MKLQPPLFDSEYWIWLVYQVSALCWFTISNLLPFQDVVSSSYWAFDPNEGKGKVIWPVLQVQGSEQKSCEYKSILLMYVLPVIVAVYPILYTHSQVLMCMRRLYFIIVNKPSRNYKKDTTILHEKLSIIVW
jgi:hypothetical protein